MIDTGMNLYVGWLSMLGGALSGAVMGMFFHRPDWLGGYGSFQRRLVRLGHIAFFGLGLLNILFGLSAYPLRIEGVALTIASVGFIVGAVTMPLFCFLRAWQSRARYFFVIPVVSMVAAISAVLLGGG